MASKKLDDLLAKAKEHKKGQRIGQATAEPTVTIGKAGRVGINQSAYEKYFREYKNTDGGAKFFYDGSNKRVVVQLRKKREEDHYPIIQPKKSKGGQINAGKGFITSTMEMDVDEIKFPIQTEISEEFFDDEGVLILKIKEEAE